MTGGLVCSRVTNSHFLTLAEDVAVIYSDSTGRRLFPSELPRPNVFLLQMLMLLWGCVFGAGKQPPGERAIGDRRKTGRV